MADSKGRIIIVSDSLFKDIDIPGLAQICAIPGAKVYTLFHEASKCVNWLRYEYTIVHCGTNDVGNGLGADVVRGLQFLSRNICDINPNMKFIVTSLLPRPKDFDCTNPVIRNINTSMHAWAQSVSNVHYANICSSFFIRGSIRRDQILFDSDGFHLSDLGVQRVVRILKMIIHLLHKGRLTIQ